jgi:transcription termination factor Rho
MDETPIRQRAMLAGKLVSELQAIAEQVGVKDPKKRKKSDLIDAILGSVGGPYTPHSGEAPTPNGAGDAGDRRAEGPVAGNGGWRPAPSEAPAASESNGTPQREPQGADASSPSQESAATQPELTAQQQAPAASSPEGAGSQSEAGTTPTNGSNDGRQGSPGQLSSAAPPSPASPSGTNGEARSRDGSGSGGGVAQTTAPPAQSSSPTQAPETRPDYRREGEGVRERDRGRRRRRRERGGDRGERPGDRQGPADHQERVERPRREPEFEDTGDLEVRSGVLDVLPEGYGFLRTSGYLPGPEDVYVSLSQVRRSQLRRGDHIVGAVRRPKEGEKYQALVRIDQIDGMAPEEIVGRKWFEKLTPLYPEDRLHLELPDAPGQIAQRIIDLVAPIGKGQRGMIVSPPKAGKTTIMKQIANSITSNNPECHLIVLLVDERPEEVTDMQRSVQGEIVYSTFDRPSEDHIQVTELTLDRAKRLVELNQDVVILLDGITRLSRAYNLATPASGRILSGGVDSTALYPPKRFFGAARNIEEGGSLTIIATALVDTGSRMDEVIFEEFKGTGNWELRLDRRASEKRIFPAIDIQASGTRKEELLLSQEELALVWKLRRVLHALEGVAALELLVDKMRQTKGNMQFLREIQKVQIGD